MPAYPAWAGDLGCTLPVAACTQGGECFAELLTTCEYGNKTVAPYRLHGTLWHESSLPARTYPYSIVLQLVLCYSLQWLTETWQGIKVQTFKNPFHLMRHANLLPNWHLLLRFTAPCIGPCSEFMRLAGSAHTVNFALEPYTLMLCMCVRYGVQSTDSTSFTTWCMCPIRGPTQGCANPVHTISRWGIQS